MNINVRRLRFICFLPVIILLVVAYYFLRGLSWIGWKAGNAEDWMDRNIRFF